MGLILRDESGRAIGSAGMMRRTLSAFGRTLEGAQAVDLNVDRQHRTIGAALALQKAVIRQAEAGELGLIYALPNPQSEAVLRRAGYREIGSLTRWVKPLSARKRLQAVTPRWLVPPAAAAADLVLRLASPETYRRLGAGLRAERIGRFDQRFDRLFEASLPRQTIVGQRTADYLNWRFAACPHGRHRVLGLLDPAGALLAYFLYRRLRGAVFLGDFLAAETEHFEMLLAELLRRLRRRSAQTVVANYLGRAEVCDVLRRLGFWPREAQWKAMLYADPQRLGPHSHLFYQPDNWHLTRADLDTDE
jgi:hypothetical protein